MIKTGKKLIVKTPKKIYNNIPWILSPINNTTPRSATMLASSGEDDPFYRSGEASTESLLTGKLSDGGPPGSANPEVPKGFVAVYVGPGLKRFEIPAKYLSMPDFRILMDETAEEYGFGQEGTLELPCEEEDFLKILSKCVSKDTKKRGGLKI